ncbi:MAG: hypothetical protein ACXVRJ_14435 [Gaiellaceae bacterium]
MLTLLRLVNVVLFVSMIACFLGALAGLIVFLPFLAGAWVLNGLALMGYEEHARPGWIARLRASVERSPGGADVVPIPARVHEEPLKRSA